MALNLKKVDPIVHGGGEAETDLRGGEVGVAVENGNGFQVIMSLVGKYGTDFNGLVFPHPNR